MIREKAEKQSGDSKKRGDNYKNIIKNGDFYLVIYFEIVCEKSKRCKSISWNKEIQVP